MTSQAKREQELLQSVTHPNAKPLPASENAGAAKEEATPEFRGETVGAGSADTHGPVRAADEQLVELERLAIAAKQPCAPGCASGQPDEPCVACAALTTLYRGTYVEDTILGLVDRVRRAEAQRGRETGRLLEARVRIAELERERDEARKSPA